MAMIPMEYMGGVSLGTPYTLTDNVAYTCPSDGYAYLNQAATANGYINVSNNGQQMAFSGSSNVVPVKEGWSIALHASGTVYAAQFIPLV